MDVFMYKLRLTIFLLAGLFLYQTTFAQDTTWILYNEANSQLPDNFVTHVSFDGHGNTWIGTWGGGIVKINNNKWTVYNTGNSAIPNNLVNHIAIDKTGVVWMATNGDIASFDGKTWHTIKMPDENIALTIEVDDKNVKWIGTYDQGLFTYDGKELKKIWGGKPSLDFGVNDIAFDNNGNAFMATRLGVLKYNGRTWQLYNSRNSNLTEDIYYQVKLDSKGKIWAAMYPPGDLAMFDGSKWETYKEGATGARSDSTNKNTGNYIYAMDIYKNDVVLTGTQKHGALATFDSRQWKLVGTPITKEQGMGVSALAVDDEDNIWIGTWKHGLMVRKIYKGLLDSLEMGLFLKRPIDDQHTLKCSNSEVELLIWDSQKIDGDIVSLNLNGQWLLKDYTLTRTPYSVKVNLKENMNNRIILFAENLGKKPPNTAALSVVDGTKNKKVILKSDFTKSGVLNLFYEPANK